MAEFYKLEIAAWNVGTDDLTLEQEAAYLRIVNAIRLYEQPIRENTRVLCGLWRCNERKAKRLLSELIEARKLEIKDGFIINEKAVNDASNLRETRVKRQSAGRLGGIESGKSRRNSLESNDTGEAPASTREEKRREEYSVEEPASQPRLRAAPPVDEEVKTRRERLLSAMGADPVSGISGPNGSVLGRERDMIEADRWEKLGLPIDSQCRLVAERMAQARSRQPGFAPRSFAYFSAAMEELAAAKNRPANSSRAIPGTTETSEQRMARWARTGS